jgi:hypothetical protein
MITNIKINRGLKLIFFKIIIQDQKRMYIQRVIELLL